MKRTALLAALVLLLTASLVHAFEAEGVIRNVDAEKRVLRIFANGRERTVNVAEDAKFLDGEGKPLEGGLKATALKEGAEVTVTVERGAAGAVITAIRLGRHGDRPAAPGSAPQRQVTGKATIDLTPLTEMSATDRYKGEDGGLYGGGSNEPPPAHRAAAKAQVARIVPLDADGKPAADGTIAFISISMSNATQEFSFFKQIADQDDAKSPRLTIVDCAQGGQAMAEWVDPNARPWSEAARRLSAANVSPNQVQVAWIKMANKSPRGDLTEHGAKLKQDTLAVIHNAKARFPNLRIVYLGSRIYGGYAGGSLNPEPYAYESAYVARWLIQDQIKGEAPLRYDGDGAKAPLLLWGPYFWADGTTPRKADGLVWNAEDFANDGTHPSGTGRRKVADMLLKFFKTDESAVPWFVKP